jgi:hypothetical protein
LAAQAGEGRPDSKAARVQRGELSVRLWSPEQVEEIRKIISGIVSVGHRKSSTTVGQGGIRHEKSNLETSLMGLEYRMTPTTQKEMEARPSAHRVEAGAPEQPR